MPYDDPITGVQYAYKDPEVGAAVARSWFRCSYELFHLPSGPDPVARRDVWIKAPNADVAQRLLGELIEGWRLRNGFEWNYRVICQEE